MPDFAALQDCGAAPKELDFSGSNDPYNKPEYMADKVGLTPEQCEPTPPPTERDLVGQGFRQEPGPGGTNVWTTPPTNGTESASVAVRDHTAIAARPGEPEQPDIVKDPVTGEPRAVPKESPEQQFNKAVNSAASVATAGIAAAVKGDFSSVAGLGGAIGDAIGIPHAGEAAALAGKVKDFLDKGGDMSSLLNDPLGSMDNLADVLGALGIEVPPVLKAAIGEAKKIADALKQKLPPGGVPGVYCEKEFVARMGTSMTTHGTPLAPGPGALTVLAMGTPVWRCLMDFHACPIVKGVVPDVGGIVPPTQFVVWAMGAPVARHKIDQVVEIPGGPNKIVPMTQAERAAEEKRKKEEEERKKREEEEKKKREAKQKEANEPSEQPQADKSKVETEKETLKKDLENQQKMLDQRIKELDKPVDQMTAEEKARFEKYFGPISEETKDQVKSNLEKIKAQSESFSVDRFKDVNPSEDGLYAQTIGGDADSDIELDKEYWNSNDSGYNSRPGTLTHEMSHQVIDTNDDAYGTTLSEELAKNDPESAMNNADNYQYYTEEP